MMDIHSMPLHAVLTPSSRSVLLACCAASYTAMHSKLRSASCPRQVELHQHPALAKRWRALERREAKQKVAEAAGASFVPLAQRPDTTLLPSLLDEFLEVGPFL